MSSSPVLVFDIETVPDIAGLRTLRGTGPSVDDAGVYAAEIADRETRGKSDFMPHYLQRVLVISCAFRNADGLRIHSLVDRETGGASQEGRIVQAFFSMIERHAPQLVSWNGSGFDLPVLHYRGLRHGVVAPRYWEMGDSAREYRYNNYIGRYHLRHIDLMDLLALYQSRANAPLDAMARLCGFPGKLGMDGSQVFSAYREGRTDEIRRYCETDVMNTYLLYCRFEKMRGGMSEMNYANEMALVRDTLAGIVEPHWAEYLAAWPVEDKRPTGRGDEETPRASDEAQPVAREAATPAVEVEVVETAVEVTTVTIADEGSSGGDATATVGTAAT